MLKYRGNITSQFGENFIIAECIKRIGLKPGVAVEFGAPTKQFCSNIYPLISEGWDCRYFDCDPKEDGIMRMTITKENVNDVIPICSIYSSDTDGPCYEIWQAYKGKPDIVIIEINSSLDPDKDSYFFSNGANFSIMNKLAKEKGYFLLCHTGNNVYLLNEYKSLFPEADTTFDNSWR